MLNIQQPSADNCSRQKNSQHRVLSDVLSESEERLRVLVLNVDMLIARTKVGGFWSEGFYHVARLLEAVPLATADFDGARRHLENARDYCHAMEFGAAAFELRIVRGNLQRLP